MSYLNVWGVLGTESYGYGFERSSPGSGKNLEWLPEMAFQGWHFKDFWGNMPPDPPSDSRLRRSFCLPSPHTQISSYGHGPLSLIVWMRTDTVIFDASRNANTFDVGSDIPRRKCAAKKCKSIKLLQDRHQLVDSSALRREVGYGQKMGGDLLSGAQTAQVKRTEDALCVLTPNKVRSSVSLSKSTTMCKLET